MRDLFTGGNGPVYYKDEMLLVHVTISTGVPGYECYENGLYLDVINEDTESQVFHDCIAFTLDEVENLRDALTAHLEAVRP